MKLFSAFLVLAGIGLLFAFSGCQDNLGTTPPPGGNTTQASMTILWPARLIPTAANSIKVVLSDGSGYSSTQVVDRPASGNTSTVTFNNCPVGTLNVTATAYPQAGAAGTPQASGTTTINTLSGQSTSITLNMATTVDHIDITSTGLSLANKTTLALTATPKDAAGNVVLVAAGNISWTSGTTAVATVSSAGLVTGVSPGTALITATENDSQKTASVTVTVTNVAPVAAFTITPASGTTSDTFSVDGSGSTDTEDAASALQVRWDWTNDGVWDTASSTTKTATHNYPAVGAYTIKMEVKDTGGLTNTVTHTVTVTALPVSVSISPTTATVSVGKTKQFTATVTNSANTSVTWTVTEAGGGTVNTSGLYTAPATAGTYHVKATSVADNTKSATAAVTVEAGGAVIIVQ